MQRSRFVSTLSITLALLLSASSGYEVHIGPWMDNFRSGVKYSTWDEMTALTTPGEKILISPQDSFDFIPSLGYGQFQLAEKADRNPDAWEAHKVLTGYDAVTEWAEAQLGEPVLKGYQVPQPNENLVGMTLVVDSPGAKELLPPRESVICHQIEVETFFCHKTQNVGVQTIEVSPHGKPSTLWLACHYVEKTPKCHVMNVGDMFFSPDANKELLVSKQVKSSLRRGKE